MPGRQSKITVMDCDETYFEEKEIGPIEDPVGYRMTQAVTSNNFCGLPAADVLDGLAELFGIHPRTVEDIFNTGQRPKLEDLVHDIYAAVKTVGQEMSNKILTTQVSLVITKQVVLSFEEREGEIFEPIREKLRKHKGRIRKVGTDYLAHRLIDAVVDSYFGILKKIGDNLEPLEERVVINPTQEILKTIHS